MKYELRYLALSIMEPMPFGEDFDADSDEAAVLHAMTSLKKSFGRDLDKPFPKGPSRVRLTKIEPVTLPYFAKRKDT